MNVLQDESEELKTLELTEDASAYLVKQQMEIEEKLRNDYINAGMVGWRSKLIGNIIRIAGLLHVTEH